MNAPKKPIVTVVHRLAGRVRARLSVSPEEVERMISRILEHAGVESIVYTAATRSMLVHFNPHLVSEQEIVLRIALYLSLDWGAAPVRLLGEPERRVLAPSAVYSAVGLACSVAMRGLAVKGGGPTRLDRVVGAGTALAALQHACREVGERGYFDPEAISLAYLLTAFLRGDLLKAAVLTWLATFGRHLVDLPPAGVEVRPLEVAGEPNAETRYELVIGPDRDAPEQARVLGALQGALKYAMTGGKPHDYRNLLDDLRNVSKVHGQVLEGFGPMRQGIPMRFS